MPAYISIKNWNCKEKVREREDDNEEWNEIKKKEEEQRMNGEGSIVERQTGLYGRTISFAGKVMSGRETPKWPRKNHANLLRSVKFPNFRSLRVVDGKGERWWKERAIRESKGQVSVWLETPRPFLTFIHLHPENFSLLRLVTGISPPLFPLFYIALVLIRSLCPSRSPCSYLMHRFASVSPSSFVLALSAYPPSPYICVLHFHGGVNGLFRLGPTGN